MTLIDDIKRSRKAGTAAPWVATFTPDLSTFVCMDDEDHTIIATISTPGSEDVKRIARVPVYEEALLAAEDKATEQAAEIDRLTKALTRIATPSAFWVATSDVDPEALARMVYAQCILDGGTAEDAEGMATVKAQDRGEDVMLQILRRAALNKEPTQ